MSRHASPRCPSSAIRLWGSGRCALPVWGELGQGRAGEDERAAHHQRGRERLVQHHHAQRHAHQCVHQGHDANGGERQALQQPVEALVRQHRAAQRQVHHGQDCARGPVHRLRPLQQEGHAQQGHGAAQGLDEHQHVRGHMRHVLFHQHVGERHERRGPQREQGPEQHQAGHLHLSELRVLQGHHAHHPQPRRQQLGDGQRLVRHQHASHQQQPHREGGEEQRGPARGDPLLADEEQPKGDGELNAAQAHDAPRGAGAQLRALGPGEGQQHQPRHQHADPREAQRGEILQAGLHHGPGRAPEQDAGAVGHHELEGIRGGGQPWEGSGNHGERGSSTGLPRLPRRVWARPLEAARRQGRRAAQPVVFGVGGGAVDEVERVGVPARGGGVGPAAVRQHAVQHHEGSLLHLQRHHVLLGQGRGIQHPEDRAPLGSPHETLLQPLPVPSGLNPQTAVLQGGILQGEPEAQTGGGLGEQERRVLVAGDFAADVGLLEDVHGLQEERAGQSQLRGQRRQLGRAREPVEHRLQVVQRMADLVDGQRLRLSEGTVWPEGVLFEEEADLVSRGQEVGIRRAGLLVGGEDGAGLGLEAGHQLLGPVFQGITGVP
ncbi:conserved hypothetical protein [Stigmatella aurantiaca DW4/3-1]|uniref:Uncharacterized protein n=1 Tax=Stigmatella aurantiaca (strain DW4/3-1) TaxID=378806 RepID=Q09DE3_STIAD|nr:conserved hypothetical protein [Stigmatella aurantiaca DW4/3-1]